MSIELSALNNWAQIPFHSHTYVPSPLNLQPTLTSNLKISVSPNPQGDVQFNPRGGSDFYSNASYQNALNDSPAKNMF